METKEQILEDKDFSYTNPLYVGWKHFQEQPGLFIAIILLAGVIDSLAKNLENILKVLGLQDALPPIALFILVLVLSAIKIAMTLGLIRISIKAVADQKSTFHDMLPSRSLLLRYCLASLLYVVIVAIGYILLIIPGIFLSVRLQFYSYCLVDQDIGVIESLKESYRLTEDRVINFFIFDWILAFVNIAGFLALGFGLLITIPVGMIAYAYVFRNLYVQSHFQRAYYQNALAQSPA